MRWTAFGAALLGLALAAPASADFVFRTVINPETVGRASCTLPDYLGGGVLPSSQSMLAYTERTAPLGVSCESVAVAVICKNGNLRLNGGISRSCVEPGPLACAVPPYLGGGRLESGERLPGAFLTPQASPGHRCSEYAVPVGCENGVLQHNGATAVSCAEASASAASTPVANCELPWGGALATGTVYDKLVYAASSVQFPATCDTVAAQLSCQDGQLSMASPKQACRVVDPKFGQVTALIHGGEEGEVTGKAPVSGGDALVTEFAKVGSQSLGVRSGSVTLAGTPLAFGVADFTVETWVYLVTSPTGYVNLWNNNGGVLGTLGLRLGDAGNGHRLQLLAGSPLNPIEVGGLTKADFVGQWRHLAVTRVHGEVRAYVDGKLKAAVSRPVNFIGAGMVLGGPQFTGHFNELRATEGARYQSDFVPNTTPFPNG